MWKCVQKGGEEKKGERKGKVKKSKGMGRGRGVNREGYGGKVRCKKRKGVCGDLGKVEEEASF